MTKKGANNYTYGTQSGSCPDGALSKPHAVVLAGSVNYCYDRNGNMVSRYNGAYVYAYDAENHLTGVSGSATVSFVYGPGGERVKGTVNGGTTTLYVNNYYEKQGTTVRKYYYAGSKRVAMREGSTLYWLLSDHLGSTAVTANGTTGAWVGEVRYKAWGEDRAACGSPPCGTTPTTFRFTGQRAESGIGLYYYGARWYDATLGRFVQADTMLPDSSDPQQLNRYTYTGNNPVRYTDPSGHVLEGGATTDESYDQGGYTGTTNGQIASDYRTRAANLEAGGLPTNRDYYLWEYYRLQGVYYQELQGGIHQEDVWAKEAHIQTGYERAAINGAFGQEVTVDAIAGASGGTANLLTLSMGLVSLPFADPGLGQRVGKTLDLIDEGGPFPYEEDGKVFLNKEGRLPPQSDPEYYQEYTVPDPAASNRGAQRIVTGAGGEAYYTPNHYDAFAQIR